MSAPKPPHESLAPHLSETEPPASGPLSTAQTTPPQETVATLPSPPDSTETAGPAATSGRRLAGAAALMAVLFLLSRVTGLGREMVISAQFGTSAELDAYLAAFRVPDLLFQMVAGGALGSAFIPIFAEHWAKVDADRAWELFSRVLNLVFLVTALLGGLAALLAQPLVEWIIVPDFDPAQQALTANLMRWMMISTAIFAVSGLIMGALNALHHFLLPGAAPVLYNLLIIAGAWWLAPTFGAYGLVMGVVAGALAHLCIQLPALWRKGVRYRVELSPAALLGDSAVRRVLALMGPRVLGIFFVQMHFLVNTILASGLDAGSLSALNFAWLLMLLPLGLFAQSVATVAFPALAAQIAANDWAGMMQAFVRLVRMIIFFTLPAAVVLFVVRVPLVQAVFERGEFGPTSTQLVAYALQFYALGLVAHAVVEIAVRAFYAMHDPWTPVKVGIGAMALNILLSFWWVRLWSFGGLALANTTATTLEMLLLLWLVHHRLTTAPAGSPQASLAPTFHVLRDVSTGAARMGVAALVMGVAVWWLLPWIERGPWHTLMVGPFITAGVGIVAGVVFYLLASLALASPELRPALAVILRRAR